MPLRYLIFVRLIRLTAGFACARVELKRVCGGRCAYGRAHGGLKSVEPRDHILSVLVGRRCCVAVGLDRERCGEIRIVKLGNASIQRKGPIFVSRVYERRTCLRRESISSSFCLIWARRYSRLLKGENEYSSSSGEEVDGEGARETTRSSILGEVKKVKGWGAKRTVARVRETSNKNGRHWRGVSLTLAHFWVFGLRQYIRACQTCSACTRSHQEGNSISSDERTRLGCSGCSGDELANADRTKRQRGFNPSTRENAP